MNHLSRNNKQAFTLVEILIVIAIVGIIATIASNLNFDDINNSKRAEVLTTTVARSFENIRNNALYGRSLLAENPDAWRISVNMSNSGTISTEYLSGSTWNPYINQDSNYSLDFPAYIGGISCDNSGDVSAGSGVVVYQGSELTFSGSCSINDKLMTIMTGYGSFTGEITINSISGVIEAK